MILADFGVILADIGNETTVWRERNVRVHVLRHYLRRATEDRNAVNEANGLGGVFRAAEVDVVSVRRKSKTVVAARGGGKNLRVARGGNVAEPNALLTVIGYSADNVFAVGRDSGIDGFAGVGDLRDGEILEGHRSFATEHGEDTVACDGEDRERDDSADDKFAFVFARRLQGDGAGTACIPCAYRRGSGSGVARG